MATIFDRIEALEKQSPDFKSLEADLWAEHGHRLAALVIDSTGFSKTTNQMGIAHALAVIGRARRIMSPVFESHSPRLQKFSADNAYAFFDSADTALACARTVVSVIRTAALPLVETKIYDVCVGMGYGDMLYSNPQDGFYGAEMNLASKLGEDTAEGGDILLTASALAALSDTHRAEFRGEEVTVSGLSLLYYRDQVGSGDGDPSSKSSG